MKTKISHIGKLATLLLLPLLSGRVSAQQTVMQKADCLVGKMTSSEKILQLACKTLYTTADNTRLGIPGLNTQDGPHGVHQMNYTSFPTSMAMAAMWDRDLIHKLGHAMGQEFWEAGFNVGLGPCIDLTIDPRGGRTAESVGEDPYLSGQIGAELVRGMQEVPIMACLKHFEIEGKQAYRKTCDEQITERDLMQFFGLNFRTALQEGLPLWLMSSYNLINGVQANESRLLLTDILRKRWGYPFAVMSDWMAIKDADRALLAGNDVCMGSTHYGKQLPKDLKNGDIKEENLDTAVFRVLLSKYASGLIGYRPTSAQTMVDGEEHRALCRQGVQQSVVLLKNDEMGQNGDFHPLLPLARSARIALIGPNAEAENLNCYGSSETFPARAVSLLAGMKEVAPEAQITCVKGCEIAGDDESGFEAALEAAREADVVVFAGGLDQSLEGERIMETLQRPFDRDSTDLPHLQQRLICQLAEANPHLVVVLQSGGVVSLQKCIQQIPALVYSFYGGQEAGLGIADILFGDVNPSGRMPQTMPTDDSQLPEWNDTYYTDDWASGYRWMERRGLTPQFPFGHGLSYTTFAYSNLRLVSAAQQFPIRLAADITNTGQRAGQEVAQLYIAHPLAADDVTLPLKELRGYERISLQPGETGTVTFELNAEDLYTWNTYINEYEVESGTYTAYVGGSSAQLPLSAMVEVSEEKRPDLKVTAVYTEPRYPRQGEQVTFYAYVKNQGNASVPASQYWGTTFSIDDSYVGFFLQSTDSPNGTSTPISGEGLQPGQGTLVVAEGVWTAPDAEEVTLTAAIETPKTQEWRTDNNRLSVPLRLYAPTEDGIGNISDADTKEGDSYESPRYNLAGQRLHRTMRGIAVGQGRKFVVK